MTIRLALCIVIACSAVQVVTGEDYSCLTGIGWRDPPPVCTQSNPCTNLLNTYVSRGITKIDVPESPPAQCRGLFEDVVYSDGVPQVINIAKRTETAVPAQRHYCLFVPPTASATQKVPLVVFFHGSGGSATVPYRTGWRKYAASGIPGVFGGSPFALIGTQALNRHWPASGAIGDGEDGTKNDYYFRNLTQNDDVYYVDAVIDAVVQSNAIDTSKIFVTGFSNGAFFGNMYASIRSGSTQGGSWGAITGRTPGGWTIASVATFSGASPWGAPKDCQYALQPSTTLPLMIVVYQCDVVYCPSALDYIDSMPAFGSRNATLVVVADDGSPTVPLSGCVVLPAGCTSTKRIAQHSQYPSALIPQMAAFMSANAASSSTPAPPPSTTTATPQTPSSPTTSPTSSPPTSPTPAPRRSGASAFDCCAIIMAFVCVLLVTL